MEAVLITGCDTGFGYYTAKKYIDCNKAVIYTYLEIDPFPGTENAYGIKLDQRSQVNINNFKHVLKQTLHEHQIDLQLVFLNAGVALGGPVENLPLYIYREVMEINFFGTIAIIQSTLPFLIPNKGKLIIHGSMAGRITVPFMTAYASSKHALESITDGLRRELYRDGVQVMILETGGVQTPIWSKPEHHDRSFITNKYEDSMNAFMDNFVRPNQSAWPVKNAVDILYKVFQRKRLPKRFRLAKNKLKNFLPLILPSTLIDSFLRKMMRL